MLFGLYAECYRNGASILREIHAEDLLLVVAQYEQNMAQLDAENQKLVLQIAAQRYAKEQWAYIQGLKTETRYMEGNALALEVDEMEKALEIDQKELELFQKRIEIEIQKAEAKLQELLAKVELETLAQAYVEVDIAEAQLKVARKELEILETILKASEIQLAIVETGIDSAEVDVRIAELGADVSTIEARIAQLALSPLELEKVQKQLETSRYEEGTLSVRIGLVNDDAALLNAKIQDVLGPQTMDEISAYAADTTRNAAETQARLAALADRQALAAAARDRIIIENLTRILNAATRSDVKTTNASTNTAIDSAQRTAADRQRDAAIAAATTTAMAQLTTTLEHAIA